MPDQGESADRVEVVWRAEGRHHPAQHAPPRWLQAVAVALLLGYLVWNSLYYSPYVVDDAFISLRYARNLIGGTGLVYNAGQYVEGYSNFSWVMIEAFLMRLDLPLITSIKLLGLASAIATALLTLVLARRVLPGSPVSIVPGSIALALICLNTGVAVWSQAGLETGFFAMLVVAMCLRFEVELDRSKPLPWSAVLFALAWMTRPEAPVYGLYFVVRRASVRGRVRPRRSDLWWILALAALVIPYEAWGLSYYGRLLPNTYAAKVGGPEGGAVEAVLAALGNQPLLVSFVSRQGWGFTALLILGAIGCFAGLRRLPMFAWLPTACGLLLILHSSSDWMPRYRLLVPTMPFLFILVGYGFAELLRRVRHSRALMVIWCLAFAAPLTDYTMHQMFAGYGRVERNPAAQGRSWGWHIDATGRDFQHHDGNPAGQPRPRSWFVDVPARLSQRRYPMELAAWRILREVPAGETICARDIGFVGFLTDNPICDLAGLFTPAVTRARHDSGEEAERLMCEELINLEPAFIVLQSGHGELASKVHRRIGRYIRGEPAIAALYRTTSGRGWVAYYRRDTARVDVRERVEASVRLFPEYERRARELLDG